MEDALRQGEEARLALQALRSKWPGTHLSPLLAMAQTSLEPAVRMKVRRAQDPPASDPAAWGQMLATHRGFSSVRSALAPALPTDIGSLPACAWATGDGLRRQTGALLPARL